MHKRRIIIRKTKILSKMNENLRVGTLLFASTVLFSFFVRKRQVKCIKKVQSFSTFKLKNCSVSAPGKALIAGGYLVMQHPNVGIVISASSRFFTTVHILPRRVKSNKLNILIESPQFHTKFEYDYDIGDRSLKSISVSENVFVEKCLGLVVSFSRETLGEDVFLEIVNDVVAQGILGIKLRADNDFYSQISELNKRNLPFISSSLKLIPNFCPCPKRADGTVEVAKTGMGSSAALTTSFIGALLQWFGVIKLGYRNAEEDRQIVHNLSQLAHGYFYFLTSFPFSYSYSL